MRKAKKLVTLVVLVVSTVGAQAALINRGGGMIYDSTLNITWLQDWNYAQTSGYDSDGLMTFDRATGWARDLVFGGYDDWRLPNVIDTGTAGCNLSSGGGTDCGPNPLTKVGDTVYSEMAHLWYTTLGNKAYCVPGDTQCGYSGAYQADWGFKNDDMFTSMTPEKYWTGLSNTVYDDLYYYGYSAWMFDNYGGSQLAYPEDGALRAVAVRAGDVAPTPQSDVPEPGSLPLVALSLGLAVGVRRFRQG